MNLIDIDKIVYVSNISKFLSFTMFVLIISCVFLFLKSNSIFEERRKKIIIRIGITVILVITIIATFMFRENIKSTSKKIINSYKKEMTEEYYIDNTQYKDIIDCFKGNDILLDYQVFKNKKNNYLEKFNLIVNNKDLKDNSNSMKKEKLIKVDIYTTNFTLDPFDKLFLDYSKKLYVLNSISN